ASLPSSRLRIGYSSCSSTSLLARRAAFPRSLRSGFGSRPDSTTAWITEPGAGAGPVVAVATGTRGAGCGGRGQRHRRDVVKVGDSRMLDTWHRTCHRSAAVKPSGKPRWRIAIVDDHERSRAALRSAVWAAGGEVAGEASRCVDAAGLLERTKPSV